METLFDGKTNFAMGIKTYQVEGVELQIDYIDIKPGMIEIVGDQLIIKSPALANQIREQLRKLDLQIDTDD